MSSSSSSAYTPLNASFLRNSWAKVSQSYDKKKLEEEVEHVFFQKLQEIEEEKYRHLRQNPELAQEAARRGSITQLECHEVLFENYIEENNERKASQLLSNSELAERLVIRALQHKKPYLTFILSNSSVSLSNIVLTSIQDDAWTAAIEIGADLTKITGENNTPLILLALKERNEQLFKLHMQHAIGLNELITDDYQYAEELFSYFTTDNKETVASELSALSIPSTYKTESLALFVVLEKIFNHKIKDNQRKQYNEEKKQYLQELFTLIDTHQAFYKTIANDTIPFTECTILDFIIQCSRYKLSSYPKKPETNELFKIVKKLFTIGVKPSRESWELAKSHEPFLMVYFITQGFLPQDRQFFSDTATPFYPCKHTLAIQTALNAIDKPLTKEQIYTLSDSNKTDALSNFHTHIANQFPCKSYYKNICRDLLFLRYGIENPEPEETSVLVTYPPAVHAHMLRYLSPHDAKIYIENLASYKPEFRKELFEFLSRKKQFTIFNKLYFSEDASIDEVNACIAYCKAMLRCNAFDQNYLTLFPESWKEKILKELSPVRLLQEDKDECWPITHFENWPQLLPGDSLSDNDKALVEHYFIAESIQRLNGSYEKALSRFLKLFMISEQAITELSKKTYFHTLDLHSALLMAGKIHPNIAFIQHREIFTKNEFTESLASGKLSVNARDGNGRLLSHVLIECNSIDWLDLDLSKDFDIHARDACRKTVLSLITNLPQNLFEKATRKALDKRASLVDDLSTEERFNFFSKSLSLETFELFDHLLFHLDMSKEENKAFILHLIKNLKKQAPVITVVAPQAAFPQQQRPALMPPQAPPPLQPVENNEVKPQHKTIIAHIISQYENQVRFNENEIVTLVNETKNYDILATLFSLGRTIQNAFAFNEYLHNTDLIEKGLKSGIQITLCDKNNWSLIHFLASRGDFTLLLQHIPVTFNLSSKSPAGKTILQYAVQQEIGPNWERLIRTLIEKGACPSRDLPEDVQFNLLKKALIYNKAFFEFILSRGVSIHSVGHSICDNFLCLTTPDIRNNTVYLFSQGLSLFSPIARIRQYPIHPTTKLLYHTKQNLTPHILPDAFKRSNFSQIQSKESYQMLRSLLGNIQTPQTTSPDTWLQIRQALPDCPVEQLLVKLRKDLSHYSFIPECRFIDIQNTTITDIRSLYGQKKYPHIERIIQDITEKKPQTGTPPATKPEELSIFYDKMNQALRRFTKLLQESNDPDFTAYQLSALNNSGQVCPIAWVPVLEDCVRSLENNNTPRMLDDEVRYLLWQERQSQADALLNFMSHISTTGNEVHDQLRVKEVLKNYGVMSSTIAENDHIHTATLKNERIITFFNLLYNSSFCVRFVQKWMTKHYCEIDSPILPWLTANKIDGWKSREYPKTQQMIDGLLDANDEVIENEIGRKGRPYQTWLQAGIDAINDEYRETIIYDEEANCISLAVVIHFLQSIGVLKNEQLTKSMVTHFVQYPEAKPVLQSSYTTLSSEVRLELLRDVNGSDPYLKAFSSFVLERYPEPFGDIGSDPFETNVDDFLNPAWPTFP